MTFGLRAALSESCFGKPFTGDWTRASLRAIASWRWAAARGRTRFTWAAVGVHGVATDASESMIEKARAKVRGGGPGGADRDAATGDGRPLVALRSLRRCVQQFRWAQLCGGPRRLGAGSGRFGAPGRYGAAVCDGAFRSLGVDWVPAARRGLERLSGGCVPAASSGAASPCAIRLPAALRRAFASAFRPLRLSAVGALLPPTEWEPCGRSASSPAGRSRALGTPLETVPPLPWLSDHYLLELERR